MPIPPKKFQAVIWFQVTGYARVHVYRLSVAESEAANFLRVPVAQRPRGASASGTWPLRALPATCRRDLLRLGAGAPTVSGRAGVQAGSRPHLAGRRHGLDIRGQGSPATPGSPGGRLARGSAQGSPRPGPASQPAVPEEAARPAQPGPGARDGTCCVLKSQPRQHGRAACSAMAADGPAARPSVLPGAAVSPRSSAQRRRARPSLRPAGLLDPCHSRACALAPPAGGRGGDTRPAGPGALRTGARQVSPPLTSPSSTCACALLHISCPNAASLP